MWNAEDNKTGAGGECVHTERENKINGNDSGMDLWFLA